MTSLTFSGSSIIEIWAFWKLKDYFSSYQEGKYKFHTHSRNGKQIKTRYTVSIP